VITYLLALLITLAIVWWLFAPHSESETLHQKMLKTTPLHITKLEDERERSLRMLNDLELDYQTGKLSDDEYELIRQELVRDLAPVLRELDNLSR